MRVKLQTENHFKFLSLNAGFTGSSESTHVKMPNCWKSHITAQMICNTNMNFIHTVFVQSIALYCGIL